MDLYKGECDKYKDEKDIVIFKSREEADAYLESIDGKSGGK